MRYLSRIAGISAVALLLGCSQPAERIRTTPSELGAPARWQQAASEPQLSADIRAVVLTNSVQTRWVHDFSDVRLTTLVERVLAYNPTLSAQAEAVEVARTRAVQQGATLLPTLDISVSASVTQTDSATQQTQRLTLDGRFEPDIWGRLSAREQQASLQWSLARTGFTHKMLDLTAEATSGWYSLIVQKQLLELYLKREDTLKNALTVVQQGYERGLNDAESLYQARSALQSEQDAIAAQRQNISEQIRALQVLLGRYPDGRLLSEAATVLPDLPALTLNVMPSELIARSPVMQSAWLELLAADAALAAANRDRFPRVSLSVSADKSFDWNLLAGLTQPLFDAGRLAAAEKQAAAEVAQKEKIYLQTLFSHFADVENVLMQEETLKLRYLAAQENLTSARRSTQLSLSQYQLGITDLTALLAAQKSMLDGEARVLQLHLERILNRIELYRLLGGDPATPTESQSQEREAL